jgi:hypothetical protein
MSQREERARTNLKPHGLEFKVPGGHCTLGRKELIIKRGRGCVLEQILQFHGPCKVETGENRDDLQKVDADAERRNVDALFVHNHRDDGKRSCTSHRNTHNIHIVSTFRVQLCHSDKRLRTKADCGADKNRERFAGALEALRFEAIVPRLANGARDASVAIRTIRQRQVVKGIQGRPRCQKGVLNIHPRLSLLRPDKHQTKQRQM